MASSICPSSISPSLFGLRFGLGIDAGGTATRWTLIKSNGDIIKQGQARGLTGLLMDSVEGRAQLAHELQQIALTCSHHADHLKGALSVFAGFTGLPDDIGPIKHLVADALNVEAAKTTLVSDIELTHRAHFEPDQGFIVYAGTGSYASFVDCNATLHRCGARGGILDDGGSGFWIARAALSQVWRAEDEQAGRWQQSSMACALFEQLGGSDWNFTRQFVYGQSNAQMRGRMGLLATAVGASADSDPLAKKILIDAGIELARLGNIMSRQFGGRPTIFAGRVFELHPIILETAASHLNTSPEHPSERSQIQSVASVAARIALEPTS